MQIPQEKISLKMFLSLMSTEQMIIPCQDLMLHTYGSKSLSQLMWSTTISLYRSSSEWINNALISILRESSNSTRNALLPMYKGVINYV